MSDIQITLTTLFDANELATYITMDNSYDAIFNLVIELEESVADWDFSEMLYRHFKKQHLIYLEEVKEE